MNNRRFVQALVLFGCAALLTPARAAEPRPVAVDLAARLAAVKGDYDGAACVAAFDDTDVTVADNGMGSSRRTRLVKLLTDEGLRSQCVQRFEFDPATNALELEAVRIHRADGKVETLDIAAAIDQPEAAWGIFWGSRQLALNVPGLRVGDAVETVHVKTGFNTAYLTGERGATGPSLRPPMPGHWYDVVEWAEEVPVLEKRYTVRMPKDKPLQYEIVNGELTTTVRFEGDRHVYSFSKKNISAFKREPQMCSRDDVICKLVLATLEDWHAKARWFYEANEPSFKTDEAIQAKVRELTAGLEDPQEKIRVLNHWVAENVRYVGTSRGACEGYTTHPVIETFHDRGGVCKDKAGLLVAMLREAGFESYIVMTEAGSRVEQTPADQFNHAVTCIRNADGSFRLLDPTWLPKNREMWSSAEQLQAVVYGTPDGEAGLQLSPYSPPEENQTIWSARSVLLPTGDLRGTIEATTLGCPETHLRRSLAPIRPVDRPGRFEESMRALSPNVQLASLRFTDPVDFAGPAEVRLEFAAKGYCVGTDGRRYLRLPALTGALMDMMLPDVRDSAPTDPKDRKYPIRIRSTRRFECAETIQLPEGWAQERLPEACKIDEPAASFEFKMEADRGLLRYAVTAALKKHVVPVDEYAGYRKVIEAWKKLAEETIVLRAEDRTISSR